MNADLKSLENEYKQWCRMIKDRQEEERRIGDKKRIMIDNERKDLLKIMQEFQIYNL